MAFLHFRIRFRDGDTIDVLADALDDLRKTLQGVRAISFTGDSHDVIEYAANLLGPSKLSKLSFIDRKKIILTFLFLFCLLALISIEQQNDGKKFVKPVANIRSFIELSYYSNSLAAHFALDAVVMCTLLKLKNEADSSV